MIELVQQHRVKNDTDFLLWEDKNTEQLETEVYIEKTIIDEFKSKDIIEIHVAFGEVKGEKIGYLFIRR